MKTMKTLGGGLGVATLALVSSIAQAEVTGNISIASEYVFRGLPSSANAAQVAGGVDWNNDKFYAGAWMSNVGNAATGNEVDLYAGATFDKVDVGAIVYVFPGGPGSRASKMQEFYAGYNWDSLSVYGWYGQGNKWNNTRDDYLYLEGNLTKPLNARVDVSLHIGYQNNFHATDVIDAGLRASVGGFWLGVTSQMNASGAGGANKYPRLNLGYNWNFDNLPVFTRF